MNKALFARYKCQIDPCVAQAAATGERVSFRAWDQAEIFAELGSDGGIAWGVNHPETGEPMLRGRRPDGSDA